MFKKIKNKLKRIIDNYDRKHGWATVRDAMSYYVYPSGEPVTSIPNAYKYHAMFILFNIIPQNRFTIPLLRKFNNYRFRKQIENLEYYKRKWNLIPIETFLSHIRVNA